MELSLYSRCVTIYDTYHSLISVHNGGGREKSGDNKLQQIIKLDKNIENIIFGFRISVMFSHSHFY